MHEYLEDNYGKKGPVFGGQKIQSLPKEERLKKAAALAPVLRGFCSSCKSKMIGHFTDDDRVLEFINSNDLEGLAPMGTSCPDHFLRTKISPLVLDLTTDEDVNDVACNKRKTCCRNLKHTEKCMQNITTPANIRTVLQCVMQILL